MSWTDERVELLRQLWLDGKSASQISAQLGHGLTRNAVIGKVHRLGLAGRAKSPSSAPAAPRPVAAPRVAPRPAPSAAPAARPSVRGNTALAVSPEPMFEARPVFLEEDVVVPMSLRVTIVELKEAMCRWPLGDPSSQEFRYCGSPASGASPYCTHHGQLAYQPVQDRRRERERDRRMLAR
jgi:GcrA cell cycle regulator